MPVSSLVIAVFAVFAGSTVLSMVGIGGGVFYVPLLLALGMSIHQASPTSLFVILGTSVAAFVMYRRRNYVDWKLALVIEPPTAAMAFVGGLLANYIDAAVLTFVLAGVLVLTALFMVRSVPEKAGVSAHHRGDWQRTVGDARYAVRLPWLVPAATGAGFVAGMIGISGGVFKMPAMVLLGRVPTRIAIGTSSLMIGATALAGLAGHLVDGPFDIRPALLLAASAFAGGQLGPRFSLRTKTEALRRFFAVLLLLVAVWLIVGEVAG